MKRIALISGCMMAAVQGVVGAMSDPVTALRSFSIFDRIDLAQLSPGDVKSAHGAPMSNGRFLSVQSCYVQAGTPTEHLEALRRWNPTSHRELKVLVHADISNPPSEAAFSKMKESGAASSFVSASTKMLPDLQMSRAEAAKFSPTADFWSQLLVARARAFVSHGTSVLAPYDHSGNTVRAGEELTGLLSGQPKIRKQFAGLLDGTGIGGGASLKPELYWELLDVDDATVATLGAFFSRDSGDGIQAAEISYYASGGYYGALTLYQMWPLDVNGRASTLVWRGDLISSASLASLRGVEKLASESAMMKDVGRAIALFRKDISR